MREFKLGITAAFWAAFLLSSPVHAGGLAGAFMVAAGYPGAYDNPGCHSNKVTVSATDFNSTQAAKLVSGHPCKTIQYACDQVLTNPNNNGPGQANAPNGSGAADWRILISASVSTSGTNGVVTYPGNIVCKAAGTDASHPFLFIGNSGGTLAHGTIAGKATLQFTGSHIKFGKLNLTNNNGPGLLIQSLDGSRLTDVVVYYDTTIRNNTDIGMHIVAVDGFESDNSVGFENGTNGQPCVKVENSTMWHFDSNTFFRCGGAPGQVKPFTGYGLEVWNSTTGFLGTEGKKVENPPDVKADLFLDNAQYTTVENNMNPFTCVVTPASDLSTDTFIGNSPCTTQ